MAIVATITAVALAVLCWPATLGAAGTFVAAHITGALAAIPLAAKVTAVATTALLALISAIGGICSKIFNKTASDEVMGSQEERSVSMTNSDEVMGSQEEQPISITDADSATGSQEERSVSMTNSDEVVGSQEEQPISMTNIDLSEELAVAASDKEFTQNEISTTTAPLEKMILGNLSEKTSKTSLNNDFDRELAVTLNNSWIGKARNIPPNQQSIAMSSENPNELTNYLDVELKKLGLSNRDRILTLRFASQLGSDAAVTLANMATMEKFGEDLFVTRALDSSVRTSIHIEDDLISVTGQTNIRYWIFNPQTGDQQYSKDIPIEYEYNITTGTFRITSDISKPEFN